MNPQELFIDIPKCLSGKCDQCEGRIDFAFGLKIRCNYGCHLDKMR